MTILILWFTLLAPLTPQAQEQKKEPEPEQLFCTVMQVEPFVTLGECTDGDGNPLSSLKPLRAPAGLKLEDAHLNPELSTVVLERTPTKLCVVQINRMGGWTPEAVNQKYGCVELKKKRNHKKK